MIKMPKIILVSFEMLVTDSIHCKVTNIMILSPTFFNDDGYINIKLSPTRLQSLCQMCTSDSVRL